MGLHYPSGDAKERAAWDTKGGGISALADETQRVIVAAGYYGSLLKAMTRPASLFCLEKKSYLLLRCAEYTCAWDYRFHCIERSLTLDSEGPR